LADLTVSKNSVSGPAKLQEGENAPHPYDSSLDGRLAFYLNGNVRQNWRLDGERGYARRPGEGPVQQLSWPSRPIRYSGASIPTIITRRSATTV